VAEDGWRKTRRFADERAEDRSIPGDLRNNMWELIAAALIPTTMTMTVIAVRGAFPSIVERVMGTVFAKILITGGAYDSSHLNLFGTYYEYYENTTATYMVNVDLFLLDNIIRKKSKLQICEGQER